MLQRTLFDCTDPREPEKVPESEITLRDYQQTAVDRLWSALYDGKKSAMILMATGTGKTVTFGALIRKALENGAKRVLVLVHRDEILWQSKNMISAMCPQTIVEVEAGELFAERAAQADGEPRSKVVVAMKDSLWLDYRLKAFNRDEFDLIIVDECHHCVPQNKTYWNIILWFRSAKVVGVTATADRTDELALGQSFESVAFEYDIKPAIDDGWLVPIVQQYVTVEGYDLESLKSLKRSGDFSKSELSSMVTKEKPLAGLVKAAVKYSNYGDQERPTLIFTASVPHANRVAEMLNRRHAKHGTGRAVAVTAENVMDMHERRGIVDAYRMGEFRYLVNFGIFTEGFDAPETRVIVMGRPTKSRSLYAQMAGRGTRPISEIVQQLNDATSSEERRVIIRQSEKPSLLVVDPVGVSGWHKLVMNCADILGGIYEDPIVEMAKQIVSEKGGRASIDWALREAKRQEEERQKLKRRELIIDAEISSRMIDPFNLIDVTCGREPGWFKGKPPTDKMKAVLEKNGIKGEQLKEMTFWKAKRMIDEIMQRRKEGKCTLNQARFLAKHEYDAADMTFDEASALINRIKANGWRRPDR